MIDASRSPRPLWMRTLMFLALCAFIVAAAWLIWVKELHHQDIHLHAFSQLAAASAQSAR